MTTSGSPDGKVVFEEERSDFGYAAGAAEIAALFAAKFVEARRRLPRHEVPFAIAALRLERHQATAALAARCAHDRSDASTARHELERQATRQLRKALRAEIPQPSP